MVKFINVFLFVWFTAFLIFWMFMIFEPGDVNIFYIGALVLTHIGLSSLYLYKILKGLNGENV